MAVAIPIIDRFLKFTAERSDKTKCWEWGGSKDKDGYGQLHWYFPNSRKVFEKRAHRISWILFNGEIPDGKCVLHKCDNPGCVNPNHLFIGSNADNMADKTAKRRNNPPIGERAGFAKLKEFEVLEIRKQYKAGATGRSLSKAFGVGFKAISKIVLRQRWKHV